MLPPNPRHSSRHSLDQQKSPSCRIVTPPSAGQPGRRKTPLTGRGRGRDDGRPGGPGLPGEGEAPLSAGVSQSVSRCQSVRQPASVSPSAGVIPGRQPLALLRADELRDRGLDACHISVYALSSGYSPK